MNLSFETANKKKRKKKKRKMALYEITRKAQGQIALLFSIFNAVVNITHTFSLFHYILSGEKSNAKQKKNKKFS